MKFQGGREASGIPKGFDSLLNLVLDGTVEYRRDPDDQHKLREDARQLGLIVHPGTSVVLTCPQDGMEALPNPFVQHLRRVAWPQEPSFYVVNFFLMFWCLFVLFFNKIAHVSIPAPPKR